MGGKNKTNAKKQPPPVGADGVTFDMDPDLVEVLKEFNVGATHRNVKKPVEALDGRGKFQHVFATEGFQSSVTNDVKLLICSSNIGNEMPYNLDAWVPSGGANHDLVVIGLQESTFTVTSYEAALEKERQAIDEHELEEIQSEEVSPINSPTQSSSTSTTNQQNIYKMRRSQAPIKREPLDDTPRAGKNTAMKLFGAISPKSKYNSVADICNEFSQIGMDSDGTNYLNALFSFQLGPSYKCLKAIRRMGMRQYLYVRTELTPMVTDIEVGAENTGIGRVLANKGGLAIKFKFLETTICCISCHLNAHEGEKYLKTRIMDVNEILSGIRLGNQQIDIDNQFHHCFFYGDLNFRTNLMISTQVKNENQTVGVAELIQEKNFRALYDMDELQHEMIRGNLAIGFKKPDCRFEPTFKVRRYKYLEYNPKRTPSYTDQILMKSLPGLEDRLKVHLYEAAKDFTSSDHKPLRASFSIKPTTSLSYKELDQEKPSRKIEFTHLRAENLPIMDVEAMGGTCDPYITFHTDPPDILFNPKIPKTSVKKRNLNPNWGEDTITLYPKITGNDDLTAFHIFLVFYDWDFGSADDLIGSATLKVDDFVRNANSDGEFEFKEVEILQGGTNRGTVSGKVRVLLCDADDMNKKDENGQCCIT